MSLILMESDEHNLANYAGRHRNKFILICQYLQLGLLPSLLFSIAYSYDTLPSYNITAFFSLIGIVPNLKFLISPLIENHTSLSYGKRKTWMVTCTGICAVLTFLMSFYTHESQQMQIGALFFVSKWFYGINVTSVDALALKEYREKAKMSFLQTIVFRLGATFGSVFFMKLISKTFCLNFGRTEPFMTVKGFFQLNAFLMLGLTLMSHFIYKEPEIDDQTIIMHKNYVQLLKQYRVFLDLDSIYTRLVLFFIIHHLGFAAFISGFRYELIQNYGFSREDYVTISTLMLIAVSPIAYYFSQHLHRSPYKLQIIIFIRLLSEMAAFILKIDHVYSVCVHQFVENLCRTFENIILNTILNEVSSVGFSGMFLSAANGIKEITRNHSWSLKLIDIFSFDVCCVVGFAQEMAIVWYVQDFMNWIDDGERPKEVTESDPSEVQNKQ